MTKFLPELEVLLAGNNSEETLNVEVIIEKHEAEGSQENTRFEKYDFKIFLWRVYTHVIISQVAER
jgi:hypothetical protein